MTEVDTDIESCRNSNNVAIGGQGIEKDLYFYYERWVVHSKKCKTSIIIINNLFFPKFELEVVN